MLKGERLRDLFQRCNKEDDMGQSGPRRRLDTRRFFDVFNYEDSKKVTQEDGTIDVEATSS